MKGTVCTQFRFMHPLSWPAPSAYQISGEIPSCIFYFESRPCRAITEDFVVFVSRKLHPGTKLLKLQWANYGMWNAMTVFELLSYRRRPGAVQEYDGGVTILEHSRGHCGIVLESSGSHPGSCYVSWSYSKQGNGQELARRACRMRAKKCRC